MKTALIVIDVQQGLFDEGIQESESVLDNLDRLIDSARSAGAPIVFVRDRRVAPGNELHPRLSPAADDWIVEKDFCDVFIDTDLDEQLQDAGIDTLIIAGLQTDFCIDTSCRSAAARGYRAILAGDAHSTVDQPDLTAAQIIAHHNRILGRFRAGKGSVSVVEARRISFH